MRSAWLAAPWVPDRPAVPRGALAKLVTVVVVLAVIVAAIGYRGGILFGLEPETSSRDRR